MNAPHPPWDETAKLFARTLELSRQGGIPCPAEYYLPHGQEWNTIGRDPTLANYIRHTYPSCNFASTLEIPYAQAAGVRMSADLARTLGADIGRAIVRFLMLQP